MATPYFEKIPVIGYDMTGNGEKRMAVNILQRIKIRDVLKQSWLIFYEYDIKDSDTPEIVAHKLYGSTEYHWLVLLANDIVDPYYDWPLTYDNLINTIRKRYQTPSKDGVEIAHQTIHHYEDLLGNVIDFEHFTSLPFEERTQVSIYDWEFFRNETKRRIRLVDRDYVDLIDLEADRIMERALV